MKWANVTVRRLLIVVSACLVPLPCGCGTGTQSVAAKSDGVVARSIDVEYAPVITNAGSARAYVAFTRYRLTFDVTRNSAAVLTAYRLSAPSFPSRIDYRQWKASGSPSLSTAGSTTVRIPAGRFSFLDARGRPVTYGMVLALGGRVLEVRSLIRAHLDMQGAGATPVAALQMLAHLLVWPQLPLKTRKAVVWVALHTQGITQCGAGRDSSGRSGIRLCAVSSLESLSALVSVTQAEVWTLTVRLRQRSSLYPRFAPGGLIESDAFG
jgi:hypothetical protein